MQVSCIRAILPDGDGLPKAVKETIENVIGEGKNALDALIMVGLLQAHKKTSGGRGSWSNTAGASLSRCARPASCLVRKCKGSTAPIVAHGP